MLTCLYLCRVAALVSAVSSSKLVARSFSAKTSRNFTTLLSSGPVSIGNQQTIPTFFHFTRLSPQPRSHLILTSILAMARRKNCLQRRGVCKTYKLNELWHHFPPDGGPRATLMFASTSDSNSLVWRLPPWARRLNCCLVVLLFFHLLTAACHCLDVHFALLARKCSKALAVQ